MNFSKYFRFIKIEHSVFSLPLLFAGAFLAGGEWPSIRVSLLILLAGSSARVVAMGLNRIVDREIDKKNPRTQNRELASGAMSVGEGWGVVVLFLGIYLFSTWLLSNFVFRLSWIPILAFFLYPYFKRFTKWAHVGLGLVWSLVPVAGYFAVKPAFHGSFPAFILGVFCIFWLAGFDIIYATMDEKFDREERLHSLPAALGAESALRWSALFHLLAFLVLSFLYTAWFSGPLTVMLLAIIGISLIIEQKFSHNVDFAFLPMNFFIGLVVLIFVVSGLKGY